MATSLDTPAPPTATDPAAPAANIDIDSISKQILDAKIGYDAKSKVAVKDIVDLMPVIFSGFHEILKQLKSLNSDTAKLSQENVQLKKDVKALKGDIMDLQYDSQRNQVRINGLKGLEGNKYTDTKVVFDKLLKDLKIPTCSYSDLWKIPAKKPLPGKRASTPTLLVQFKDSENKAMFFKNLSPLKQLDQYKIFVNNCYPAALADDLKDLETAARVHRDNGLQTKISYVRGGSLALFTRSAGQQWQKLKKD